jgi:7-cyano-7-deazaguanine synthase
VTAGRGNAREAGGVALLSGGLDSTVAAAHALCHGGLDLALFVDYGQRSVARESAASSRIAQRFGVEYRAVAIDFLRFPGGSPLLDRNLPLPTPSAADLDNVEAALADADSLWVPNRNGLFINIAACLAEAGGAERVIVGFNAEEGLAFPDNSEPFLEAATAALRYSTQTGVRVESPTAGLDKAALVRLGLEVGAPLELIWSCYGDGEEHCWECTSCLRLKRALEANGIYETFRREHDPRG